MRLVASFRAIGPPPNQQYEYETSTVMPSVILFAANRTWESTPPPPPPPPASWIAANAFLILSVTERETWRPSRVLEMPKCVNEERIKRRCQRTEGKLFPVPETRFLWSSEPLKLTTISGHVTFPEMAEIRRRSSIRKAHCTRLGAGKQVINAGNWSSMVDMFS